MLDWSVSMYQVLFREDKDEHGKFSVPSFPHPQLYGYIYNQHRNCMYLRHTNGCFECIQCEPITTLKLISITITSHSYLVCVCWEPLRSEGVQSFSDGKMNEFYSSNTQPGDYGQQHDSVYLKFPMKKDLRGPQHKIITLKGLMLIS